ncbi:penicillin-binding protein 2 [Leucothrix pacifica]|uniref:Peptidoglycan D,D-transpeptidase MrdA n=1 Tax=Leucothrix pacifica TaxID=1247513 RepID=A0A317C346_9GAMM|nr:penicillin-binding protein 2 [Leucothrix pacifica]PWQ93044.1 penicillin-binding protein 2 [Leucothrix pacifica]
MSEKKILKDEKQEHLLFRSRAIVAALVVALLLSVIGVRLFYLQITNHEHLTELSQENYQKRIPTPPVRGQIYDRNGIVLADNKIEYVLEVTRDKAKNMDEDIATLQEMISITPKDINKFKQQLRLNSRFQPVILRSALTEEEIAIFSVNRFRFPGFAVNIRTERVYPFGSVASHVIGYVGRIDTRDLERLGKNEYKGSTHVGKTGIERFYESRLHGKAGFKKVEMDAHSEPQRTLAEESPISGEDLFLSIDLELQTKAENLLQGQRGAIVAMDPRNGEVLAMVSVPMFDSNLFVNGISYKNYNALRDNPDRPLFNRALQGAYPPGSTIKPAAALVGLNEDVVTQKRSVFGRGFFQIPGTKHRYRCWKKTGHGHISLNRAIYQSCDVYFYDLAYRMGVEKYSKAMNQFGFGSKTGIDLPHERSGLMPTPAWKERRHKTSWYPGDTVNIGIGQGYWTASPLQLAHSTAIIAMRGKRMMPHVLKAIRISRNLPEKEVNPQPLPSVIADKAHWDAVIQGMVNTVHGPMGTARRSGEGAKYRFAGKTGTAQVFGIAQNKTYNASKLAKRLHDHSLFVAFAPLENPTIAISVIVENGGGGSAVAAPLARKLLDAYLLPKEEPIEANKEDDTDEKKVGQKPNKKNNNA